MRTGYLLVAITPGSSSTNSCQCEKLTEPHRPLQEISKRIDQSLQTRTMLARFNSQIKLATEKANRLKQLNRSQPKLKSNAKQSSSMRNKSQPKRETNSSRESYSSIARVSKFATIFTKSPTAKQSTAIDTSTSKLTLTSRTTFKTPSLSFAVISKSLSKAFC